MVTSQRLLENALPPVLAQARDTALAGALDTGPLEQGAILFPLTAMEAIVISGRDRARFLHAMLSSDIQALTEGTGIWATFNDVKGHTISDVRLLALDCDPKEGSMLALVEQGASEVFISALDRFVIAEKVYFEPQGNTSLWLLAGAGSEAALSAAGADLPPAGLLGHGVTDIAGATVRVVRLDRSTATGRDLLLLVEGGDEATVLEALSATQRGEAALLEAARIESGQPRFGIDFTQANIPLECGLTGRALDFDKGCYPGQEVICRIHAMGAPARRLVRLAVRGEVAPEPGTLLFRNGREVGYITSSVRSQRLGGVVALGYLGKRHCEAGSVVQIGTADGDQSAEALAVV
jgi:folate-binding protein YgfZ